METLLNLVISDPIDFDETLYSYWLEGKTPEEALELKLDGYHRVMSRTTTRVSIAPLIRRGSNSRLDDEVERIDPQLVYLLRHDILDHYRTFEILVHYVCFPSLLSRQTMLQIPPSTQLWIIEKYYELDDVVVRELIGRKMSKNRKDLDDISELTRFPLRRVTRQFDNLKRMSAAIEEKQSNILTFVENQFVLPFRLARKYACLLFMINGKFNVTSKKRLQRVTCTNLEHCAAITMACLIPDRDTFHACWK